ncbi:MAG: twin-arginine translocase subunit TatC [Halobacteriales archaeon]|nr:twin-arginine translocase subunit TatC [Halobacteriales archaeon]
MAPEQLPAWATWAVLAALAIVAAAAASVGAWLRRSPADRVEGVWGHVTELRRRLVRSVMACAAAVAVVFVVRVGPAPPYIAVDPYDNLAAQVFRRMAADLKPADVRLIVTAPADGFVAMFDVALGLGLFIALPYVLAQVGGFVWPALRSRERRLLGLTLGPATLLFAVGALFAYRFLLPPAFTALYAFSSALGADGLLDVAEFVSFTVMLLLLSGAAFLTPLAMLALARIGLATPQGYLRYWRHAVVAIVVVAAVVTPDPTPVSQLLVAGPLVGLYFLGVALAVPARRAFDRSQT